MAQDQFQFLDRYLEEAKAGTRKSPQEVVEKADSEFERRHLSNSPRRLCNALHFQRSAVIINIAHLEDDIWNLI